MLEEKIQNLYDYDAVITDMSHVTHFLIGHSMSKTLSMLGYIFLNFVPRNTHLRSKSSCRNMFDNSYLIWLSLLVASLRRDCRVTNSLTLIYLVPNTFAEKNPV